MAGIVLLAGATIILSGGALTGLVGFKAVTWLKAASLTAEGVDTTATGEAVVPGSALGWAGIGAVVAGVSYYYYYFQHVNSKPHGKAKEKEKD